MVSGHRKAIAVYFVRCVMVLTFHIECTHKLGIILCALFAAHGYWTVAY